MKITIFNGSPKADMSVTMQYVNYAIKRFAGHDYEIFNVTRDLGKITDGSKLLDDMMNSVRTSTLVIWAFPVFGLLVPAEYKKFIELVWERHLEGAFAGKYAAAISTSIHFLDNYARYYINAVSDDLDMKYLGDFFADSGTLLDEGGRTNFEAFFADLLQRAADQVAVCKTYQPAGQPAFEYSASPRAVPGIEGDKKVVILHNDAGGINNLSGMTARFKQCFKAEPEVIPLKGLIRRGCMECYKCTMSNKCVFDGIDGFSDAYFKKVREADIVVFADTIHDRHLSSEFKYFVDRCFVVNHQPRLPGKKVGFILSGPLDQMVTLRHALEAWVEANEGVVAGIVSDSCRDSAAIDAQIANLAQNLSAYSRNGYAKPGSFETVGTRKIYRDAVWGELRKVFVSDHKYYKKHNYYDFPQRSLALRLENIMMSALNHLPAFRKWFLKNVQSIKVKKHIRIVKFSQSL